MAAERPRRRPWKRCAKAGCSRRTRDTYCARHAETCRPAGWADREGSASSRGYGAQWRRTRKRILARDPFCRVCGRKPSTEVDHRVPRHRGGDESDENLQGICSGCHGRKSAREGHAASRGGGNR